MKLLDNDEVLYTYVAYDNDEVLLASTSGYITRYPISLIPLTSPRSKGVKAMNLGVEEIGGACIYHNDAKQLVVFADTGAMKRIKLSEIEITGRPTKGSMLCKKVKSKPYRIQSMGLYDLNDEIIISNDEIEKIISKDIPLMSKDATFSTPIKELHDYYIMQSLIQIEQVEFIESSTPVVEEVENVELTLFE